MIVANWAWYGKSHRRALKCVAVKTNAGSIPATSTNLNYIIMPNMSYCRFENTVNDMRDCINAIEDRETDELSSYEVRALEEFLDLARDITNLEYDIEQILEDYDS